VGVGVGRAHSLDTFGVQPLNEAVARLSSSTLPQLLEVLQ
jgi:hypothetical protein